MASPVIPSLVEYMATLTRQSEHPDPTEESSLGLAIDEAAAELAALEEVTQESLAEWVRASQTPKNSMYALGLTVGLTHEKLTNELQVGLGTAGFVGLARKRSVELIEFLDDEFGLVALLDKQRRKHYNFGDVLVARAGTRAFATRASAAGRSLEDEIEAIAVKLGLPYAVRGSFTGRDNRKAPFDLAIPGAGEAAQIVVAAKGFDSTGSKLGDAVREVEDMANVRRPDQYVMAVIDGIGWHRRKSDLRKIHHKWKTRGIEGMYTRAMLGDFERDLRQAAIRSGLITP